MKIIIFLIFISTSVSAQTFSVGKTPEQILDSKKKATLKFQIFDSNDKLIETFAGFFIGNQGNFVTVYHAIDKEFPFQNSKNKIFVKDYEGKVFNEITFMACSNKSDLDICIGKVINYKPKNFFEPAISPRVEGQMFTSVGQCTIGSNQDEFIVKNGQILKNISDYQSFANDYLEKKGEKIYNKKSKIFQVSLEKCEGDSGGPIFDAYTGALLGTYSFFSKRSSATKFNYYAVDVDEISKLLNENSNQILYTVPAERIHKNDNCRGLKLGSREYKNCIDLE